MEYNPHDVNPFLGDTDEPMEDAPMGMVEGDSPPPWGEEDMHMTDAEALGILVYRFRGELGYPPLVLR